MQLCFNHLTNPLCFFLLQDVLGKSWQPILRQFVNLIKHTIQPYSSWNTSGHLLNDEKIKSVLMSSQNITLLYPFISSHWDLVSTSFKHVCNFFNKCWWRLNLNLNCPLWNRYNVIDLIFLFKEGLSLISRKLSFNSSTDFLFFLVNTLKLLNTGQ